MKYLTLSLFFLWTAFAAAQQTVNRPLVFANGSSLTIQSGVTATFSAGSVVDFTGATVTGLTGGGGSGNITAVENPVAGNIGVWRSGTTLGVGSATEVLTYSDSGDSFIPYFNTAPTPHIFDRLLFGAAFTIAGTSPNQILNVGWLGLDKTGSDLADVVTRNFADLQNKPTTLPGYGVTAFTISQTVTAAGTTGAQTINKAAGTVNFAAAATTLVVTDSLVTTSSTVYCSIRTNDSTALIKNVIPAAGSFTIRLNAAATAETSVGFFVVN